VSHKIHSTFLQDHTFAFNVKPIYNKIKNLIIELRFVKISI